MNPLLASFGDPIWQIGGGIGGHGKTSLLRAAQEDQKG